jgi:alpha-N-arabinofuranosidase
MRVCDFTPISDMTGLIEFGGVWKKRGRVYGVPAYWAFRMYSNADATTTVESRVDGPTYDIEEGNTRFTQFKGVPYLDVVAALNDKRDRLTLFAVNRDDRDRPARIRLAGFRASGARLTALQGENIYQVNDETRPEAVRPVESSPAISGADFNWTFPRASVTVLELRR